MPLRAVGTTTDPMKASRARMRVKRPKAETAKTEPTKRKPESSKPSPAPGRK